MITNQLSLNYLSKELGVESFKLFKATFEASSEDGHFKTKYNDKELAAMLFEFSISDDFFMTRKKLSAFFYALPVLTQYKILSDLNLNNIENLKWSSETSDYFINEWGINEKFRFKEKEENPYNTEYVKYFNKPEKYFKRLKSYQANLFYRVSEYVMDTPFARCIIQMPTGSGKTRTAIEIVCEIMNETGRDVLWLSNTQELCDQAFEAFDETWGFLRKKSARAINHVRLSRNVPESDSPTFHVTSLQGLPPKDFFKNLTQKGIDHAKLELVIVDEAHISIAPTYRKTIEHLISNGAKLIGLTATPGRQLKTHDSEENRKLSDFYFNKLFELDAGDELPIDYLRSNGILAKVKFTSIEGAEIEKLLTQNEIKNSRENKSIPKKIEAILTNDIKRNSIIFNQLVKLLRENKKIIFFGTSIEHSKLMTALLNIKGFKAQHVDGNSGKYRREIIQKFKNNEIQILCNYGVLSTGFDDPRIDVVFMARPTNSIVLYSQIIGRGLRGPLIGGTDSCEIFTVFDNILDLPENNEIYSYFEEYFIN